MRSGSRDSSPALARRTNLARSSAPRSRRTSASPKTRALMLNDGLKLRRQGRQGRGGRGGRGGKSKRENFPENLPKLNAVKLKEMWICIWVCFASSASFAAKL